MIITLCGSSRFEPWFLMWHESLALAGHAVFALTSYPSQHGANKSWYTPEEKKFLDQAHLLKIKHSDRVLFLNVFAYLGESSLNEFEYAVNIHGPKKVSFLQSWGMGFGIYANHTREMRAAASAYGVPEGYKSPIDTSSNAFANLWSPEILGPGGQRRSSIVERLTKAEEIAYKGPNGR